jgi:transmembrane sensor
VTESPSHARWWRTADKDTTHIAASEWIVRLQDPDVSLEETLAWQDWMKAHPRHAEAFARLENIAEAMREIHSTPQLTAREFDRDRYDGSIPLSDWQSPRQPHVVFAIAAAVAVIGGILVALLMNNEDATLRSRTLPEVFVTSVGQTRTIPLRDGSTITLGGNTRVAARLGEKARSIELTQGEAFFKVAKDINRPFRVHAGDATVIAVGTEFDVRRDSDRAVVAVTEGRVIVEPNAHLVPIALLRELRPKLRPVRVDAGEQTTAASAGIEEASKIDDPATMTAWQTGRLAFRLQPLRYVIEQVNRYTAKPIVIDDERIGSLLITGTVLQGSPKDWIASLEEGFGLQAVEEPGRIVLRARWGGP